MPKEEKKGDGGKKDSLSDNPVIVEMGKAIKGLGILLTQQQAAQAKTNESINSLVKSINDGKLSGEPKKKEEVDPDAINELENAQLIPLVLEEVGKLIDSKMGTVQSNLDKTNQNINEREVESQYKVLLGTNPDLIEWTSEMKDLSIKTPGLSLKQLYTLARDGNETKSAEVDEKHKDKSDDKKVSEGFLSLMPTSGAIPAEGDEKLTKREAGEQAWEDTLQDFPGLAQLGEG